VYASAATSSRPSAERTIDFTYSVSIPGLESSGDVELWLPMPIESQFQRVSELRIDAKMTYEIVEENVHGNHFVRFTGIAEELSGQRVKLAFRVTRRAIRGGYEPDEPTALYMEPDSYVPISGIVAERAARVAPELEDSMAVARALYDDVVSNLDYDKSGTGWGLGDAVYACTAERGNCTDFHSLFIAMCRARGIPARFTIGFPLPVRESEGLIAGYHCWAEFYVEGRGWIPVDASEASKNPDRTEFYFGSLDPDRVEFTRGRDLVLPGHTDLASRNYFIYPLLLVDGIERDGMGTSLEFSDVAGK
jgi:transglutaminase-like putative cysteine protease